MQLLWLACCARGNTVLQLPAALTVAQIGCSHPSAEQVAVLRCIILARHFFLSKSIWQGDDTYVHMSAGQAAAQKLPVYHVNLPAAQFYQFDLPCTLILQQTVSHAMDMLGSCMLISQGC